MHAHTRAQWTNQNWGRGVPAYLLVPQSLSGGNDSMCWPHFHRQCVARRQPWQVPGAPATLLPSERFAMEPHTQSREQCANTGAQCERTKVVTPGAPHLMHPGSPLEQSPMGTYKFSHWPHTWRHLTHHRLVFYSIPSPSSSPRFSTNLQLNPWAIIPLPSAPNCSTNPDFPWSAQKEMHSSISYNCPSGMEEG